MYRVHPTQYHTSTPQKKFCIRDYLFVVEAFMKKIRIKGQIKRYVIVTFHIILQNIIFFFMLSVPRKSDALNRTTLLHFLNYTNLKLSFDPLLILILIQHSI